MLCQGLTPDMPPLLLLSLPWGRGVLMAITLDKKTFLVMDMKRSLGRW